MSKKLSYIIGLIATILVVLLVKYSFEGFPFQVEIIGNHINVRGPGYDIAMACIKVFSIFTLLFFLQYYLMRRIEPFVQKTKTHIDDALVEITEFALGFGKYVITVIIATQDLVLSSAQQEIRSSVILIGLWFLVLWTITHLINHSFRNVFTNNVHRKFHEGYTNLKNFFIVFLWLIGVAFLLDQYGFNVKTLLAGAGVGGIAIAIACGRVFGNIFSSFIIIVNKPFQIGDTVRINNVFGTVERIGMLYTDILDLYGQRVHIANEKVQSSVIENFGVRKFIRSDNTVYLDTGCTLSQIQKATECIEGILARYEQEVRIQDGWMVVFDGFAPGGQKIHFRFKNCGGVFRDMMKCREKILLEIKETLQKKKIAIAKLVVEEK